MDEKNEIIIPVTLAEYRDLVKRAEILEAVKRYVVNTKYFSESDLKIILDIREPTETEGK